MTGGNNCKIFRLKDKQEVNRYIADHSGTYDIYRYIADHSGTYDIYRYTADHSGTITRKQSACMASPQCGE